jgi:hypothetical protein
MVWLMIVPNRAFLKLYGKNRGVYIERIAQIHEDATGDLPGAGSDVNTRKGS